MYYIGITSRTLETNNPLPEHEKKKELKRIESILFSEGMSAQNKEAFSLLLDSFGDQFELHLGDSYDSLGLVNTNYLNILKDLSQNLRREDSQDGATGFKGENGGIITVSRNNSIAFAPDFSTDEPKKYFFPTAKDCMSIACIASFNRNLLHPRIEYTDHATNEVIIDNNSHHVVSLLQDIFRRFEETKYEDRINLDPVAREKSLRYIKDKNIGGNSTLGTISLTEAEADIQKTPKIIQTDNLQEEEKDYSDDSLANYIEQRTSDIFNAATNNEVISPTENSYDKTMDQLILLDFSLETNKSRENIFDEFILSDDFNSDALMDYMFLPVEKKSVSALKREAAKKVITWVNSANI